ncbi:MAG: pirin family protein [Ferruginibacter sp.]|nr:pirin family protein [Ferruginibacter sp.]
MKMTIQRASERGGANHGWLNAKHYFSFASYHNPEKVQFGLLRVLNDDAIAAGAGFPPHTHDNMEIVTIPLSGALQHKDNTGGEGVIKAGDVQIMSAGTGVQHSEFNASKTEDATLFQVWIFPKKRNIKPRYDQRTFDVNERANQWQIVVSPNETDNALWINQDARFALTKLAAGKELTYQNAFKGNGVYLVVVTGSVEIDGKKFNKRDAVGISEADQFTVTAAEDAELMAIEIPMN